jgi:CheY-like chemotaxis protein
MESRRFRVLIAIGGDSLRGFAVLLENEGHLVETATSRTELVARLRHLEFDLVVMDAELNGEPTSSVAEALNRSHAAYVVCRDDGTEVVQRSGLRTLQPTNFTPSSLSLMIWKLQRRFH